MKTRKPAIFAGLLTARFGSASAGAGMRGYLPQHSVTMAPEVTPLAPRRPVWVSV